LNWVEKQPLRQETPALKSWHQLRYREVSLAMATAGAKENTWTWWLLFNVIYA